MRSITIVNSNGKVIIIRIPETATDPELSEKWIETNLKANEYNCNNIKDAIEIIKSLTKKIKKLEKENKKLNKEINNIISIY